MLVEPAPGWRPAAAFGNRVAKELLPTLDSLANDGLDNVIDAMTDEFADASARLTDNLGIIGNAFTRLTVQLVGPVAKALADTIELMDRATPAAEDALVNRIDQLNSAVALARSNAGNLMPEVQLEEVNKLLVQLKAAEDALGRLQQRSPLGGNRGGTPPAAVPAPTPVGAPLPAAVRRTTVPTTNALADEIGTTQGPNEGERLAGTIAADATLQAIAQATEQTKLQEEATAGLNREFRNVANSAQGLLGTIQGLSSGTLEWHQALGPIFGQITNIVQALSRVDLANFDLGNIFGGGNTSNGGGFDFLGSLGGIASSIGSFIGFADGGVVTRPTLGLVGEAGPEAIIPLNDLGRIGDLSRMGDVMQGTELFGGNAIANRIEPGGGKSGNIDVQVIHRGDIVDPRVFRNSDEEIMTVIVNGMKFHSDLRDAVGTEVGRRAGR